MALAAAHIPMEHDQLQQSSPPYNERPNFVNHEELLSRYICGLCSNIPLKAHQTTCGKRVCKKCIDERFGDKTSIPCPLSHDDLDEEELESEECLTDGLSRDRVTPDHNVQNRLLRESCYCKNREYGCPQVLQWRRLVEHEVSCSFTPISCKNVGCYKLLAGVHMDQHLLACEHTKVACQFCGNHFKRKDLEDHFGECDLAETECKTCRKSFAKRKRLIIHQRTHPGCLAAPGKCHYFDYCKFETDDLETLRSHLRDNMEEHMEYLAVKVYDIESSSNKGEEICQNAIKDAMRKKILPLEKVTARVSLEVKRLNAKVATSETSGDHLVNAMKTVSNNGQKLDEVQGRVTTIERQIRNSGLDRVTVIESLLQNLKRHSDILTDMEKRMTNKEFCSYDGVLIWKIDNYKKRKSDAIRGRQMSIYSHHFYTSRSGYKMCCRAYLNGDGLGRSKCLSLFFVLMKGEYDELLRFPFKQRVTFSLLCPTNSSLSKHETFLPDPDSSSFRKPQTEMNIASGCPQFALHTDVESSNFLVNDCIYVRVRVEPGGDVIG